MHISINTRIKPEIFFLIAIISFFIVTNIIWLAIDTMPPSWDDSVHMKISILYSRLIPQIKSIEEAKRIFSLSNYYPPFFHLSALPILYLFGFNEDAMVYLNFLYLAVLVFSVFGIGKIMFDVRVAIISALLTLFYPIMFGLSRRFLLDFALVAMVALVQYLSLKCAMEVKKYWGYLLMAATIAAVLVKQSSIVFFIPAMMLVFFTGRRNRKRSWPFFLGMFASTAFVATFYHIFLSLWSSRLIRALINAPFPDRYLGYATLIKDQMISPYLSLFFLIGIILFLIFDRRWKTLLMLTSGIMPAFLIFGLSNPADIRYIAATAPFFAIITVGGINALPIKFAKNILLISIICVSFFQFFNLSFGLRPSIVKEKAFFYNRSPSQKDWKVKDVIEYISQSYGCSGIKIAMLPNCEFFNHEQLILYITLKRLPYSVLELWSRELIEDRINECDIVVTKSPFSSLYFTERDVASVHEKFIKEALEKYHFSNIGSIDLPDSSTAEIYKRRI